MEKKFNRNLYRIMVNIPYSKSHIIDKLTRKADRENRSLSNMVLHILEKSLEGK